MANVELSGPLVGQNFTDETWRAIFGGEPGIVGDTDGTAYKLTLPGSGDVAEIGSTTIDSKSIVAGFSHSIPAGTTHSVTIPPASNAVEGRTDIIVARYNPAYSTVPGPVRLAVVTGVEGSLALPAVDTGPPGVEEMPLYAVRRIAAQPLASATVTDLRVRQGPNLGLTTAGTLPTNVPLGSRASQDGNGYVRELVAGVPTWVQSHAAQVVLTGTAATASSATDWARMSAAYLVRWGKFRQLHFVTRRASGNIVSDAKGGIGDIEIGTLHSVDRPQGTGTGASLGAGGIATDVGGITYGCTISISPFTGSMYLVSTSPNVTIGPAGPDNTIVVDACWMVA